MIFFHIIYSCSFRFSAPPGFLIKLDFRNKFNIEPSQGCEFDYLEVSFSMRSSVQHLIIFFSCIDKRWKTWFFKIVRPILRRRISTDDLLKWTLFVATFSCRRKYWIRWLSGCVRIYATTNIMYAKMHIFIIVNY